MKTVTLRLEASLVAEVDKAAAAESIDRSAMVGKLVLESLDRHSVDRALKRYQAGEITIGRATEEARRTHWEIIELVRSRGIIDGLTPEQAQMQVDALMTQSGVAVKKSRAKKTVSKTRV